MSEATRGSLLAQARAAFAAHGFAGAPIDEVVAAAGLTKGAVYHHFGSKVGLFEAVVRDCYRELQAKTPAQVDAHEPVDGLIEVCRLYLEGLLDPALRRILLVEAPSVLGTEGERRLAEEYGGAWLAAALEELHAAGCLEEDDQEALNRVVTGALTEIALWMGETPRPRTTLNRGLAVLGRLLSARRERARRR